MGHCAPPGEGKFSPRSVDFVPSRRIAYEEKLALQQELMPEAPLDLGFHRRHS